ncbi:Uncharacterised protein [Salmonella enterica subsp. diarizonae]|nr:Uncharacterised protein [Salmonella enterica subsp. diarizonae]
MMRIFWIFPMIHHYWRTCCLPCQKNYILHQKKMCKVSIKNSRVGILQQVRLKLYYAGGQLARRLKILLSLKQQEVWRGPIQIYCLSL